MRFSWVGWDADGVLVDSFRTASRVAEGILGTLGVEARIDSPIDYQREFGRQRQDELVGENAGTLRDMHRLAMFARAREFDIFHEVLTIVDCLTVPASIYTSNYAQAVASALGQHSAKFKQILGFESGKKEQLLKQVCSQEGGIYITDSVKDIQRCHGVGLPVVAVTWGYGNPDPLAAAGPLCIVNSPSELLDTLVNMGIAKGLQ